MSLGMLFKEAGNQTLLQELVLSFEKSANARETIQFIRDISMASSEFDMFESIFRDLLAREDR